MKKIAQSFLALAALVVLSTVSRAVWDSTLGNMPSTYPLCWGLASNACIYGSTVSNFVRIQTGGIDALTVNSTQAVGIPGNLSVTGTTTMTGAITTGGNLIAGGQFLPVYYSTAALQSIVPVSTGAFVGVFNANGLYGQCTSTGVLASQWVWPSTATLSLTISYKPCN